MYTPSHPNTTRDSVLWSGSMVIADSSAIIVIVDDDISMRESLEDLLRVSGWRVRSFASASAFLEWRLPETPCCIMLDVTLPDFNGLDLQERLARDRPDISIILMTGYGDIPMSVRAMKAGALEFLTKPLDDNVLLPAVEVAIEKSRNALEDRAELKSLEARYALLSRRERQVMHLVVAGLLNKQVGGELDISEITVKAHRGRVMEKMAAANFADLVRMCGRLNAENPGV